MKKHPKLSLVAGLGTLALGAGLLAGARTATEIATASTIVTYEQSVSGTGSGTTMSRTFANAVKSRSLLVGIFRGEGGPSSVSDSLNGAWTKDAQASDNENSIWYRLNSAAGRDKVTVTASSSGSLRIGVVEYQGVAGVDGTTSCRAGTRASVTADPGSVTGMAGDLALAALGVPLPGEKLTAGPGSTMHVNLTGSYGTVGLEDQVSTGAATVDPTFTLSTGTGDWAACAVLFKPASPDPATTPSPTTSTTIGTTPSLSGTYDQTVASLRPVGAWDFSSPSATEPDLSGRGNNGTYKRTGTYVHPTAMTMPNGDTAAHFDGASQYLEVPSSANYSIPTTKAITVVGWINPDTDQFTHEASSGYVDWGGKCNQYSPTCEWELREYSTTTNESPNRPNDISFYVFNPSAGLGSASDWHPGGANYPITQDYITPNKWYMVVGEAQINNNASDTGCTTPVGTIDIWVDTVKWDQAPHADTGCMSQHNITPRVESSPLEFGTMAFDTWFQGGIGKVSIYNYELSQTQINSLYTAMTGKPGDSGMCATTCSL